MPTSISTSPSKSETKTPARSSDLHHPLANLQQEIDRLFTDFSHNMWSLPFRRPHFGSFPFKENGASGMLPAVDIIENDKGYEITTELAGMDQKDIDVKVANGMLTIQGEKRDEKEEKKKDYYLHERNFGSFTRSFAIPDDVDADKLDANFKKNVLTVTLPKKPGTQKPEKKIEVKQG